jgi:glycosyltransferase involved in cell wall biosynthesis
VSAAAVAALFVGTAGDPGAWGNTVASLRRSHPEVQVVCGAPDPAPLEPLTSAGAEVVAAASAAELANRVATLHSAHVLLVSAPAMFPDRALDPALAILADDRRVGTVSFLCDAAGFTCFPERNRPVDGTGPGLGADETTRRLRSTAPPVAPATLPVAAGPAVVLAAPALSAVGRLQEPMPGLAVADFSARARRRGFLDLVDAQTFLSCAGAGTGSAVAAGSTVADVWTDSERRRCLLERHPFLAEVADEEAGSAHGPLGIVHGAARAKVLGVRVLIDATWIGRWQMGTQVQTVSLVDALSRRPDVQSVVVALNAALPPTVDPMLANPKVVPRAAPYGDLSEFPAVDVVHRPFQPDGPLPVRAWRKVGSRTVLTVLDLIAFHVGAYHPEGEHWAGFRRNLRLATAMVDGVVVPAADVARHVGREYLSVEPRRLFVVGLGTDHLRGDEPETPPAALAGRGLSDGPFVLVLGADYAHKNRDVAITTFAELRRRGFAGGLVLVGPSIPVGSSRALEAAARAAAGPEAGGAVVALADVRAEERNWLLRHASLVLYPTSAEGFGFIPYEAARFGTPTVLVPVGPLETVASGLPVVADDWSAAALADAAERLLADPDLADAQVRSALASAGTQTWDATAARLVDVYRSVLAMPPVPA